MSELQQQAQDLFNITLTDQQDAQFSRLQGLLLEWNTRINLTAITEPGAIRTRHFLDSLSVTRVADLTTPQAVLDVGTGAGFPGLPLAISFPALNVALMDATGKKIDFVQHVIDTLGLTNAHAFQMRAEDAGRETAHRAKYDLVLARSVARMPTLMEYTLPLAAIGGHVIAMKGKTAQQEAVDGRRAIIALGGELKRIEPIALPDPTGSRTHYLVHIEKVSRTPGEFPRRAGTPAREPLL
jgi:16S rRNA (guanine527-N7)-methyltransferase